MPTVATYFGRVIKAPIVGAVREARRDQAADRIVPLKKPDGGGGVGTMNRT